ncbi:hypothetical protein GCM10011297_12600 [Bacterioplanes sanyensis]|jgi:hypothetical protein|nr:hypothetical protein GCM10011297_12600 [Bacterioplanes sanyensis]
MYHFVMPSVVVSKKDEVIFRGLCDQVSPLGFQCELPLSALDAFRDDCGRYCTFDVAVTLSGPHGRVTIDGEVGVHGLHRCSQDCCRVTFRYVRLSGENRRLMAEQLAPEQDADNVAWLGRRA